MIDLSAFKDQLNGRTVAVYGLGLSGLSVVEAFVAYDIPCHFWDDNDTNIEKAKKIGGKAIPFHEDDMANYAFLVLSPGIPFTHPSPHPVVTKAQEAGLEIICDVEFFYRALKATDLNHSIIGITGTNGKSTTTALIGHILKDNDVPSAVGGNIGKAVMSLDMPEKNGWIVLEISSFQLDLCRQFRPDIGVLINMVPDHLDRHGDMDGYVRAKTRMFQNGTSVAVIGVDNKVTRDVAEKLDDEDSRVERIIPVSIKNEVPKGVYDDDGQLIDTAFQDEAVAIGKFSEATHLPGLHNRQNIIVGYAAARCVGLNPEKIIASIQRFDGLPHRLFLTTTINGISYINDSKATNIDSAKRALACFKKIYWIIGGRPKTDGLEGAEEYLERIRHAFLIGEASDDFAKWFEKRGIDFTMCGTLEKAVDEAHEMAQSERGEPGGAGTVLLSPACASFDQYKSFEERGDHFVHLVQNLQDS